MYHFYNKIYIEKNVFLITKELKLNAPLQNQNSKRLHLTCRILIKPTSQVILLS